MTFTDPTPHAPAAPEDTPTPKPRGRQKPRSIVVPSVIRTRLVPDCAWPTEADALPVRRGKRR